MRLLHHTGADEAGRDAIYPVSSLYGWGHLGLALDNLVDRAPKHSVTTYVIDTNCRCELTIANAEIDPHSEYVRL